MHETDKRETVLKGEIIHHQKLFKLYLTTCER